MTKAQKVKVIFSPPSFNGHLRRPREPLSRNHCLKAHAHPAHTHQHIQTSQQCHRILRQQYILGPIPSVSMYELWDSASSFTSFFVESFSCPVKYSDWKINMIWMAIALSLVWKDNQFRNHALIMPGEVENGSKPKLKVNISFCKLSNLYWLVNEKYPDNVGKKLFLELIGVISI